MDGMSVEVIDGRTVDQATADEIAEVASAATKADSPQNEPQSAEYLRLKLKYGWDDLGTEHVLLGRVDGSLAAWATVELPIWDNQHMAFVELDVAPQWRDSDIGEQMLDQTYAVMKATGRTLLLANAWKESDLERFWLDHGLTMGSEAAQRRLRPADLDWPRLEALYVDALAASSDYEVFEATPPVADELLDGLVQLQLAMNDAPLNDLVLDDNVWTAQRYRGNESAMAHRAATSYRLAARHRDTGEMAGFTGVVVEDDRRHLGFQEDTAVVREHRGHRLGLRLKIEMLRLLRDREPGIVQIDTWNAVSNSHMIAVNEAIGCFVVGLGGELQRDLAAVDGEPSAAPAVR
jgi:GNAT superfamily N-acetyltransferase